MPAEELWTGIITEKEADDAQSKSGFDPKTGIYHSLHQLGENLQIPTRHDLDTTSYVLSQFPHPDHAETKVALVDLATNQQVTYAQLHRSIHALASGLYNGLGVRKSIGVVFLSPNSILYPTISPEEVPKLVENGMPTLVTTPESNDDSLSVKELIECGGPLELPQVRITQSDTAAIAILYSSGTTGTSKAMLDAVQAYKINNIPAVPPVILGLVKHANEVKCVLSSLRRVGSGAAPLSKEL
ncbi:hypothetical protein D5086_020895 [Populus alba]|uniref:Uncharacterized protein n=1 Tax=Populus alba TaxID=43335 RepID=A0ACC4BM07_POPAL